MAEEYVPGSAAEKQQIENDILKMKLMLETGAKIHSFSDPDVPPEIENYFLQNVMEFERQYKADRKISVFEKIGRPDHFRPVTELVDQQIDYEWEKLKALLCRHNIELSV